MKTFFALILITLLANCSNVERRPSSFSSVLFIGDSQTEGYFGEIVYEHLKNVSLIEEVSVYGVGSSSPRHWGRKKSSKHSKWLCERKGRLNNKQGFEVGKRVCPESKKSALSQINASKPELVIFQFLGNSMGQSEGAIKSSISMLLRSLNNDQECLFLTSPPYYNELKERNILREKTQDYFVQAIGSRCKVVLGVTPESFKAFSSKRENYLGDKIHLSKIGAQRFFESVRASLP